MSQTNKTEAVNIPPLPPDRTDPAVIPFDRSLSFADQAVAEMCLLAFEKRKKRERRLPRENHQMVGDITHQIAAMDDPEQREAALADKLRVVPEDDRVHVEMEIREIVANFDKMDDDGAEHISKDKVVYKWVIPSASWALIASGGKMWMPPAPWMLPIKPDNVDLAVSEHGDNTFDLQIVDKKSAYVLKDKHLDQVFHFGMVAHLDKLLETFLEAKAKALGIAPGSPNYPKRGAMKLVVRLGRSGKEFVRWYKRSQSNDNLRTVLWLIRKIEDSLVKGEFKPTLGEHCFECPYRAGCDAFKAWAGKRKPADEKPRYHRIGHPYRRRAAGY